MIDRSFWRGKRVLITGHTGFKGSWLALWLQRLGADVSGYALPAPTEPSLFTVARVADGMESHIGDVRDLDRLTAVLAAQRPDIVIHMAAQPLVRYSYAHPVETYATNVMGTVHVLEAIRQTGSVRAVVGVTSDKCYENKEWDWGYREIEPMGGHDPYSNSKGCAELVIAAYRASYFATQGGEHPVALASARAGNVIGGGDWAQDRLIPDMIKAFLEQRPVVIRHPDAIRPWQHVLEPLRGYLTLAERLYTHGAPFAEGWNFGPEDSDAQPVGWIVEQLRQLWGDDARWELDAAPQPHEARYLKLDCSKAQRALGWRPQLDLATSLVWIVEWYRAYEAQHDLRSVTEQQIARYEQLGML